MLTSITYYLLFVPLYLLSLLPWRVHYMFSDVVLYPLARYVLRYRRPLVRQQLAECFPEKTEKTRLAIEREFYHWFADVIVESIKQISMTRNDFRRHMTFEGVEDLQRDFQASDAPLCIAYLGHYSNWEWATSFALYMNDEIGCAQIYHPLENEAFDRLMKRSRSKCGADNVAMKNTLRYVLGKKREGKKVVMGIITDQSPFLYHIRHWMQWMNHESPVIIGAELIGQKVGAIYYYFDIQRVKRGYYHAVMRKLQPVDYETPFPMTEAYMHALGECLQNDPAPWLWTHKRWKHKREVVEQKLAEQGKTPHTFTAARQFGCKK